jgi:hypothetical protein
MPNNLVELAALCDADTPDEHGVAGIDYLKACAVEALTESPIMQRPCSGCAFVSGTEASRDPITSMKAAECVERSHAFWCHMPSDGYGDKTHLCAGWISALMERGEALRARARAAS